MTPRFDAIGLVVSDMAASLAFYRRLGLDVPPEADSAPHAEAVLPGGLRMMWDTEEAVRAYTDLDDAPAGDRTALAFRCAAPAEVDALYGDLVAAGYRGPGLQPRPGPGGRRGGLRHPPGLGRSAVRAG
ncbi:VOC family protein, partial [Streptomyces fradiae]|uniref:VOC family protein n=1 Tax=Streptomyces fradiae TaxID=1906 RepID=UPI0033C6EECE